MSIRIKLTALLKAQRVSARCVDGYSRGRWTKVQRERNKTIFSARGGPWSAVPSRAKGVV